MPNVEQLQSQIAALTKRLNDIVLNSKSVEEFPLKETIEAGQFVHISVNGSPFKVPTLAFKEVQNDLLDAFDIIQVPGAVGGTIDLTAVKQFAIDYFNNLATPIFIKSKTLVIVSGWIGQNNFSFYFRFTALGGFYGIGANQLFNSFVKPSLHPMFDIRSNFNDDPFDEDSTWNTIEDSINNLPQTYLTESRTTFRREIATGNIRVYQYIGSQSQIGENSAPVSASDFVDITDDGGTQIQVGNYLGTFNDLLDITTQEPNPVTGMRADKADGRAWFRAFANSWQEVSTQLPRIKVVGDQNASATLPDAWHLSHVPYLNTTNIVLTLEAIPTKMSLGHSSDHFSYGTGTVTINYNPGLITVLGHDLVTPLVVEKATLENGFVGVTVRYLGVVSSKMVYSIFGNLKTT